MTRKAGKKVSCLVVDAAEVKRVVKDEVEKYVHARCLLTSTVWVPMADYISKSVARRLFPAESQTLD